MTNYSVFISFKNTYEGKPTVDAELAEKLYTKLTSLGIATFYSNDSIKNLGASEYKESINNALESSSVLILLGSKSDFIKKETAPWVYYEWGKFHSESIHSGDKKIIVPYLSRTISRQETPFELRDIQTFTIENNSIDDVAEFVVNCIAAQQRVTETNIETGSKAFAYTVNQSSFVDSIAMALKQRRDADMDELKRQRKNNIVNSEIILPHKASKRLKSATIAAWFNIAIVSLTLLTVSIMFLVAMGTFVQVWGLFVLLLTIIACYPSICAVVHYGRITKLMPKAVNAIFITMLCLPAFSLLMAVLDATDIWSMNKTDSFVIVLTVFVLMIPGVTILGSIVYSAIVLRKRSFAFKR